MCGIVGYIGRRDAVPVLLEGLRGWSTGGMTPRASPSSTAADSRSPRPRPGAGPPQPGQQPGPRQRRHRAHAVGDARRAERAQRPPARRRQRPHRPGAQRHHRERRSSCARSWPRTGHVFTSDTDTEVAGPPDRGRIAARLASWRPRVRRGAEPRRGHLRARRHGRRAPRRAGRGAQRQPGRARSRRRRDVRRLRRRRPRAAHAAGRPPRRRARSPRCAPTASRPRTLDDTQHQQDARRRSGGTRPTTSARTSTTCARRSPSSPRRCGARSADASTRASHTAHLGGIDLDAARAPTCGASRSSAAARPTTPARWARMLVEQLARVPADAEPASEFRYRNPVIETDTLYIAVSQSGETARHPGGGAGGASARAAGCSASSTWSAAPSRASAAAASTCTPGRRSRSPRPRPSPACRRLRPAGAASRPRPRPVRGRGAPADQGAAAPCRSSSRAILAREDEIATLAGQSRAAPSTFFIGRVRG